MTPASPSRKSSASGPLTVEGGLMLWTIVVFLLLLADPQEVRVAGGTRCGRGAGEGAGGAARRGRAEPGRGGGAAGGAQEARRRSAGRRPRRSSRRRAMRGGQGTCGGARKDEAGAGRAAGARPARDRGASATGRSPICGGRQWTSRSRPRPSSSVSGSDRRPTGSWSPTTSRRWKPALSGHDDRPELRRGTLRPRRAQRADVSSSPT